ncbi:MAG: hypothetical protein WEB53_11635 [Akkermansiaceae bacterium]
MSAACRDSGWLRALFIGGAICAVATIPLSPSSGGNLALALMVAAAGALLLARAFSSSKSVISTWLPALALVVIFASSLVPLIDRGQGPGGFYGDSTRVPFWRAA